MTRASGRFLLDTNIAILLLAQDPVIDLNIALAEDIFLPVTALGELYFGAEKSGRPEANRRRLEDLFSAIVILPCEAGVAREYGRLKAVLRKQGTPIPDNDIWIAAVALRNDLTLVTRDRHFELIPGLSLNAWR